MNTENAMVPATSSTAVELPANLQEIMGNASNILNDNRARVQRAKEAGQALLERMEAGMDESVYNQGLEFLSKIRKTITLMNETRKPVTQIIGEVSKMFTGLEADIDPKGKTTIPGAIQVKLDAFAAELARRKAEEERLAALKLAKEKAKIEVRADFEVKLNQHFVSYMQSEIDALNRYWSGVTLETFDEVTNEILNFNIDLNENALRNIKYSANTLHVTPAEVTEIMEAVITEKFPDFRNKYREAVHQRRDEITLVFNSRKLELKEIASASEAEALRLRQIAEERERAEQAETLRKSQEMLDKANAQTEVAKNTAAVETLFDIAATVATPAVKIKEQISINVNGPAGWMAVLAFYFEKEAKGMTSDQLEKKFGFARKFAESYFDKHGEEIKSPYLTYTKTAKAK